MWSLISSDVISHSEIATYRLATSLQKNCVPGSPSTYSKIEYHEYSRYCPDRCLWIRLSIRWCRQRSREGLFLPHLGRIMHDVRTSYNTKVTFCDAHKNIHRSLKHTHDYDGKTIFLFFPLRMHRFNNKPYTFFKR